MKNKDRYIFAMEHIKFKENLKNEIRENIGEKLENKKRSFVPKTIISLACIQVIFCFFATSSVGYFMV